MWANVGTGGDGGGSASDHVGWSNHSLWSLILLFFSADPAFPPLGYWRGYVWGPMAQLTYWSLENYSHIPIVAQAKAALAKQMTAMEQHIWELTGHVCENFNPHKYGDAFHCQAMPLEGVESR